jgi:hypothetical protein
MLKISQKFKSPENIVATLIVLLIPFWNIPHTIAIRYSIALSLLIAIFYFKPNWKELGKFFWLPAIWIAYLLIYTFLLADNFQIAIKGFRGEWLKSILFIIMGFGAGLILSKSKNQDRLFLAFGLASLIPILTHLYLFTLKAIETKTIPFAYWGIHEHHADLGYTGLQAITFLTIYFVLFTKNVTSKLLLMLLIGFSIISPIVAKSRAGIAFALLALTLSSSLSLKFSSKESLLNKRRVWGLTFIVLIVSVFFISKISDSDRWSGIFERMGSGFHGNSISIICDGPNALQNHLSIQGLPLTEKDNALIKNLGTGDSYRITTARAGIELLTEFPMGMSGTKDAYAAAIRTKCLAPKIPMDHTHNGWIDTALSIGVPGVLIYAAFMLMFIVFSFNLTKDKNQHVRAWAIALLSLSILWALRAIFDSVQRDQMLEIQSFFLPFAMACIIGLKSNSNGHNGPQT